MRTVVQLGAHKRQSFLYSVRLVLLAGRASRGEWIHVDNTPQDVLKTGNYISLCFR